jgi:ferric-dicitrate binding protein FerR (iron transport regulator)
MALPAAWVARLARRHGPAVARMAYRRWQAMTPEEKERYRQRARGYADRGRAAATRARTSRGGQPPDGPGPPDTL